MSHWQWSSLSQLRVEASSFVPTPYGLCLDDNIVCKRVLQLCSCNDSLHGWFRLELDVGDVNEGHHCTALQHLQLPVGFVVSDYDSVRLRSLLDARRR